MKRILLITMVTALILVGAINVMAIEEAKYDVIKKDNHFEIREYAPHIIAETVVEGNLEDAGKRHSKGFFATFRRQPLSRQSGDDGPCIPTANGGKNQDDCSVTQQRDKGSWVVSFMMPSSYTIETLPEPEDPRVSLRQVPARRMAAIRYSGFWSEKGYLRNKAELESWMNRMGLIGVSDPIWARYNPPFIPWFLRRNEILIPIDADAGQE